uniref:Uncharacterized protein n=1 Tax=Anguilla anguilla TaxID=7936 RepID=A0A0E9UCL9_ANGAN
MGKIQVRWVTRNRIPTGRRVKPYIHDVLELQAAQPNSILKRYRGSHSRVICVCFKIRALR